MHTATTNITVPPRQHRLRDIDAHVGARIRERRMNLGFSQQQIADIVGVTFQQMHKYETGFTRVSAGRLYDVARALDADIGFFFEGLDDNEPFEPAAQRRLLLDLARTFVSLRKPSHAEAICMLARALAADAEITARNVDTVGDRARDGAAAPSCNGADGIVEG